MNKEEISIEVTNMLESDGSFGVRATASGPLGDLRIRHTFPKKERYLDEDDDGVPNFIESLKDLYIDRAGAEVSSLGNQEKNLKDYKGEY